MRLIDYICRKNIDQLSWINSVRNLFRNYKDEGIYIYKTR